MNKNHQSQEPTKPINDLLARGIACMACGCCHHSVLYTRPYYDNRILRRRECRNCGRRMTTVERVKG